MQRKKCIKKNKALLRFRRTFAKNVSAKDCRLSNLIILSIKIPQSLIYPK